MTNRNAIIVNRTDKTGKIRTETARRDEGTANFALTTNKSRNASKLFIDLADGTTVKLNGHEVQTLARIFDKHYSNV
jgi:hypothetical protein